VYNTIGRPVAILGIHHGGHAQTTRKNQQSDEESSGRYDVDACF